MNRDPKQNLTIFTMTGGIGGNGKSPDSTTQAGISLGLPNGGAANKSSQENMYSLKWNTQLMALQRSLANLWDSGIGTDAVLLCQGVPLPVHKIILTAASPYVAQVVQSQSIQQIQHMMPVIVIDISAEAGKALLSFLYCGEAHVPVSIIPELVAGAKFLGISGFGEPGVLESLTSMMPDRSPHHHAVPPHVVQVPSPSPSSISLDKSVNSESPCKSDEIPTMQLPNFPATLQQNSPAQRSASSSPFHVQQHGQRIHGQPKKKKSTFIGTSILDNLLKNPKNADRQQYSTGSQSPVNLTSDGAGKYAAEYADQRYYYNYMDESEEVPAQLLEPNVEYHIGKEMEGYGGGRAENPLLDLAKVASSMERGKRKVPGDKITSTGQQGDGIKIKIKKQPEPITCDICGKKFSNAYNLRVHMEGHSGQVFVCSVCSHASRSRDALRKHFAYRHRELWISGMSAFRKNVPGRKLSISKQIKTEQEEQNNNEVQFRGGSDGTLTISGVQ